MIFQHTTPAPDSPFWLFHFGSLTLARLILHPGGPHVLEVQGTEPPTAEVFQEFAGAIEAMAQGFSNGLTLITHPGGDPPASLILAPLSGSGFVCVTHYRAGVSSDMKETRRMALGWLIGEGPIGPLWSHSPRGPKARMALVDHALATIAEAGHFNLDSLAPSGNLPALWLEKSDSLASPSSPSSPPSTPRIPGGLTPR